MIAAAEIERIDPKHRPKLDALRAEVLRLWSAPRFDARALAHVYQQMDIIIGTTRERNENAPLSTVWLNLAHISHSESFPKSQGQ
jgi:hypothetical protein